MIEYFHLAATYSDRLMADDNESYKNRMRWPCPISGDHSDGSRRIGTLKMRVKHNFHRQPMIWGWIEGYVVHESLLAEYQKQGFTGYRTRPAIIQFRDGSTSNEYQEFIVTGWGGMATPESGVHVDKSCPACHWKHYSPITNYEKLIDWSQWTGDDFFMVWPLPRSILITEMVAEVLRKQKSRAFRLARLQDCDPLVAKFGFTVGRLSGFMPEDLAIQYGTPLGLE